MMMHIQDAVDPRVLRMPVPERSTWRLRAVRHRSHQESSELDRNKTKEKATFRRWHALKSCREDVLTRARCPLS
jgi:hypothetical protein